MTITGVIMDEDTQIGKDETSDEQINKLANYILREFMYEIDDGGAVDVAIRIMEKYKRVIINK